MERDEFLNRFFDRCNPIPMMCSTEHDGRAKSSGIPVERMKQFKQLTELVDYDCQFKDGHCKLYKDSTGVNPCCCSGCFINTGYLATIDYKDVNIFAEHFKDRHGFWTPNGCSLPRDLRSAVCLCHSHKKTPTIAERNLFYIISEGEDAINSYCSMYFLHGSGSVVEHLKERLMRDRDNKIVRDKDDKIARDKEKLYEGAL